MLDKAWLACAAHSFGSAKNPCEYFDFHFFRIATIDRADEDGANDRVSPL